MSESYKVVLRVYDLSQGMARALSAALIGKQIDAIYHTGIVVYGREYFYSGGIQKQGLNYMSQVFGIRHYKEEDLGETQISQDLFESFLSDISDRYTAENYDLLEHNCNNFTNEASEFLVGKGIPDYIINLPNEAKNSPIFQQFAPLLSQMGVIKGTPTTTATTTTTTTTTTTQAPPQQQQQQQPSFPIPPPSFAQPPTTTPVVNTTTSTTTTTTTNTSAAPSFPIPPNNDLKHVFFLENSQLAVCINLMQSTLSSTASLSGNDITLLPKLNAELSMIPNEYSLSPNINDLIFKIFQKSSKSDTSLLYIIRLAVLQQGLRCLKDIITVLITNLINGEYSSNDLLRFQVYLTFCNCFNTNNGKLEIMKALVSNSLFEQITKDFPISSNQTKVAISALIQNICIELICLDQEKNINDLTTEIICFINTYVSAERDCQNYLLGGLIVLASNCPEIKQFYIDLDILSSLKFVTHPRAMKVKKLIST